MSACVDISMFGGREPVARAVEHLGVMVERWYRVLVRVQGLACEGGEAMGAWALHEASAYKVQPSVAEPNEAFQNHTQPAGFFGPCTRHDQHNATPWHPVPSP